MNHQQHQLQDQAEQDTDVLPDDDDHIIRDPIVESASTQPEKSITELLPINNVTIPNEKVGCIFVTRHLQQFLEGHSQINKLS